MPRALYPKANHLEPGCQSQGAWKPRGPLALPVEGPKPREGSGLSTGHTASRQPGLQKAQSPWTKSCTEAPGRQ